jgi:chitinase
MKRSQILQAKACIATIVSLATVAILGVPAHAGHMIGYWEGWNTLPLASVSPNYDIIDCAFGTLGGADNATVSWSESAESTGQFQADINTLHQQGKFVILSIGGQNSNKLTLANSNDVNSFVTSVENLVNTYHFDGIDLDLEQHDLYLQGGDTNLYSSTTPTIVNLITACNALTNYYGLGFFISSAPQTLDICAYGSYGGGYGDYLPFLYGCRGLHQLIGIQAYNSGSMYTCTGGVIAEGTPGFGPAMAELLLHGYNMANGQALPAFPQHEVAFGVPATSAAGGGYIAPGTVLQAAEYLGNGYNFGGNNYTLVGGPYPDFAGVMDWDCNYDNGNGNALANQLVGYLHGTGNHYQLMAATNHSVVLQDTNEQFNGLGGVTNVAACQIGISPNQQVWGVPEPSTGVFEFQNNASPQLLQSTSYSYLGYNNCFQMAATPTPAYNDAQQRWSIVGQGGGNVELINTVNSETVGLQITNEIYQNNNGCYWVAATPANPGNVQQWWLLVPVY